jgi:hypothetical protein
VDVGAIGADRRSLRADAAGSASVNTASLPACPRPPAQPPPTATSRHNREAATAAVTARPGRTPVVATSRAMLGVRWRGGPAGADPGGDGGDPPAGRPRPRCRARLPAPPPSIPNVATGLRPAAHHSLLKGSTCTASATSPHLLDLAGGRRHPGPDHRRADGPPGQRTRRPPSGQRHGAFRAQAGRDGVFGSQRARYRWSPARSSPPQR